MSKNEPTVILLDTTEKIEELLPHRGSALLINSATALIDKENETGTIVAILRIDPTLSILEGHFPEKPVFRGVDLLESMAQAAALLGLLMFPTPGSIPYFEGTEKVNFLHIVTPEDELTISVKLESKEDLSNRRLQKTVCRFTAEAHKRSKLMANAVILGSIASLKKCQ